MKKIFVTNELVYVFHLMVLIYSRFVSKFMFSGDGTVTTFERISKQILKET